MFSSLLLFVFFGALEAQMTEAVIFTEQRVSPAAGCQSSGFKGFKGLIFRDSKTVDLCPKLRQKPLKKNENFIRQC